MEAETVREALDEAVFMFDDSTLGANVIFGPTKKKS